MNSRERFLEIMNFNTSIRTLDWEFGYWYSTIQKWYKQGLIKKYGSTSNNDEDTDVILGQALVLASFDYSVDKDVAEQLNLDKGLERVCIHNNVYPPFTKEIIDEKNDFIYTIGRYGEILCQKKDKSTFAKRIKAPIKDDKDWENYKEERLQLRYDSRKPNNWEELKKHYKNRDFPLSISSSPIGFFGIIRYLIGEPQIYYIFYDNPKLIHKMNSHLCDLWINLFSEILNELDVDCAYFWEDMAGRQGSIISPAFFNEFMSPYYRRLIGFLKSRGIKYFFVDTDGKTDDLIPLFIECGINGLFPFEVQAGNNIIEIRKKYPNLLILGGLDKRILSQNQEKIDKELSNKLPFLLKTGGYIPFADHLIPPDANWENFKYYRKKIKHLIGKDFSDFI